MTVRATVQMATPRKNVRRKSDRIRERSGEQSEHRHGRRPDPADHRARGLIAEAEILRQPQDHRLVRDRVGRVDEKLDQERQPKLALRSASTVNFPMNPAKPRAGRGPTFLPAALMALAATCFFHARMQLHHVRDKFAPVEQREVFELFAGADKARRNSQLILNRDDDPPLPLPSSFVTIKPVRPIA